MPGRIKAEDLASVKERSSIEDIVREHVTLRPAGAGSLKGLCPFHEEKTPSFTIRPSLGVWHCFGCNEGGDVISFVEKVEQLTFTEAVERLAGRAGVTLRYEDGGGRGRDEAPLGRRTRLIEANRVAAEFYATALLESGEARPARDFMRGRGFDGTAARRFGVGFAPRSGEALVAHLRGKGFTDDELVTAGLAGRGRFGLYDRFRGRLVWPIRDVTGDTLGFGARRLFEDDRIEAKYLNTPETPLYKKTSVLYGLDLAKKEIAGTRQAVIVEGYTDVMACHLSGVTTAVATCGTAFGVDHIRILRRLIRDEAELAPGRVVFTFDGDAAGQKAAMKAFGEDQRWASQSYVAVAPGGQDPCDLRLSSGDGAVAALVADAVPMFDFAVQTRIARFDLDTAVGRVEALKAVAPIIATIRDRSLRPEYARTVAGWLGVQVEQVAEAVKVAGRSRPSGPTHREPPAAPVTSAPEPDDVPEPDALPEPDLRDPAVQAERQLLQCLLQYPSLVDPQALAELDLAGIQAPVHRAVLEAVRAAGGPSTGLPLTSWVSAVNEAAPPGVRPLIAKLAVARIPVRMAPNSDQPDRKVVDDLLLRVRERALQAQVSQIMGAFQRLEATQGRDQEASRTLSVQLRELQLQLATLRDRETE